jgi:hypothetical protein
MYATIEYHVLICHKDLGAHLANMFIRMPLERNMEATNARALSDTSNLL